jgi:hypothetical protein
MRCGFERLVKAVEDADRALTVAKMNLQREREACRHLWDNPYGVYAPIKTKGYMTKSLMGHFTISDDGTVNAPEIYVPPTETPRWIRTCAICGTQEITERTETQATIRPVF